MTYLIPIIIAGQAVSYNPTLLQAGLNRQTKEYPYRISQQIDIDRYDCLLGLPYGYQHLVGAEVYFLSDEGLQGPFLVTDYESSEHKGTMKNNNLLADIDCFEYVHQYGWLFVKSVSRRQ